jgi:hypothetical protein
MIVKRRIAILLSGACASTLLLTTAPVWADDAQTAEMQRQIKVMQQQLQALQAPDCRNQKDGEGRRSGAKRSAETL